MKSTNKSWQRLLIIIRQEIASNSDCPFSFDEKRQLIFTDEDGQQYIIKPFGGKKK